MCETCVDSCSLSAGEGSFGRVLQAKAQGIVPGMPDRNIVAIKTTKGTLSPSALNSNDILSLPADNATSIEREELLAELQLMKVMEPHENILNLLGHCTTPGSRWPPVVTIAISALVVCRWSGVFDCGVRIIREPARLSASV